MRAVLNLSVTVSFLNILINVVYYIFTLVITDKVVVSSMLLYLQPNRTCIRTMPGIEAGYVCIYMVSAVLTILAGWRLPVGSNC